MPEFNKRVLITGASSGIGFATAQFLLSKGAKVSVCARHTAPFDVLKGDSFYSAKADVSDNNDVKAWVADSAEKFGGIDVLINNAGQMYYMDMAHPHHEEMMSMVQTNCIGFLNVVNACMPYLLIGNNPHMLNITSDAGKKAFPGLAVYSATKAFIEFASQAMRVELKEAGIRITTVQPGNVHTRLHTLTTDKAAQETYGTEDEGQYLAPEDVVNAIYYALSSPSKVAINEVLIEPQAEPI